MELALECGPLKFGTQSGDVKGTVSSGPGLMKTGLYQVRKMTLFLFLDCWSRNLCSDAPVVSCCSFSCLFLYLVGLVGAVFFLVTPSKSYMFF